MNQLEVILRKEKEEKEKLIVSVIEDETMTIMKVLKTIKKEKIDFLFIMCYFYKEK